MSGDQECFSYLVFLDLSQLHGYRCALRDYTVTGLHGYRVTAAVGLSGRIAPMPSPFALSALRAFGDRPDVKVRAAIEMNRLGAADKKHRVGVGVMVPSVSTSHSSDRTKVYRRNTCRILDTALLLCAGTRRPRW